MHGKISSSCAWATMRSLNKKAKKGLTFGAGLRYPISTVVLRFDYTYQTFGRLNPPQWFALSLEF